MSRKSTFCNQPLPAMPYRRQLGVGICGHRRRGRLILGYIWVNIAARSRKQRREDGETRFDLWYIEREASSRKDIVPTMAGKRWPVNVYQVLVYEGMEQSNWDISGKISISYYRRSRLDLTQQKLPSQTNSPSQSARYQSHTPQTPTARTKSSSRK
jgi:hypothetical protein